MDRTQDDEQAELEQHNSEEEIENLKGKIEDLKFETTWWPIEDILHVTKDVMLLYRDRSGIHAAAYGDSDVFPHLPGWFELDYSDEVVITKNIYSHWMYLPKLPKEKKEENNDR